MTSPPGSRKWRLGNGTGCGGEEEALRRCNWLANGVFDRGMNSTATFGHRSGIGDFGLKDQKGGKDIKDEGENLGPI